MSVLERYERALQIALKRYGTDHPEVTRIINILEAIEREENIVHVRARTMDPIDLFEQIHLHQNGIAWMAVGFLKKGGKRFGFGDDPTEALQELLGACKEVAHDS